MSGAGERGAGVMADAKAALRARIVARRSGLDTAWRESAGAEAQRRLMGLEAFRAARLVSVYLALPREAPTDGIVAACGREGKRVCVPARRPGRGGGYGLAELPPDGRLIAGALGVREPERPVWVEASEVDFFVVPGLAFGRGGGRVGHGAGYYDRLLAVARPGAFKAGLAFEFQIFPSVPEEAHDVRLDAVVTEAAVYGCGSGAGPADGDNRE